MENLTLEQQKRIVFVAVVLGKGETNGNSKDRNGETTLMASNLTAEILSPPAGSQWGPTG